MSNDNPQSIAIRDGAMALATKFSVGVPDGQAAANLIVNQLGLAQCSPQEIMQMIVVCREYGLNPFTNQIYAFPQNGKMVPIVGIDGWNRIAESNTQFNGIEIEDINDSEGRLVAVKATLHRKDREFPTTVVEYLDENFMSRSPVWKQRPRRMLRHRARAQAIREGFGVGIFGDMMPDEAQEEVRTIEANDKHEGKHTGIYDAMPEEEKTLDAAASEVTETFGGLSEEEKEAIRAEANAEAAHQAEFEAEQEEARGEAVAAGMMEFD